MGRWFKANTRNIRLRRRGRTWLRAVMGALAAIAFFWLAINASAQQQPSPDEHPIPSTSPAPSVPTLLPESGIITANDYLNPFYEFAFELQPSDSPTEVERRFVRTGLMAPGSHALLSVLLHKGDVTTEIDIQSWDETSGRIIDTAKAAKQEAAEVQKLKRVINRGPKEVQTAAGVSLRYLEEWSYRTGRDIHVLLFVRKGHLIRVAAVTNDPEPEAFGKWLVKSIRFDDYAAPPVAQAYTGPTVPTSVVDDALARKPGLSLPSDARMEGDSWVSTTLGLRYHLPGGWKTAPASAPDLFARYHPLQGQGTMPRREQDLLRACSRSLLQATGPAGGIPGAPSSDEPPSLSLLAADEACLGMTFPTTTDQTSIAEYISTLSLLPDCGEVRSPQFLMVGGSLFFDIRGLVSYHRPGGQFTMRRAQAVYLTERPAAGGGHQILFWFFTAAHDAQIPGFAKTAVEFLR